MKHVAAWIIGTLARWQDRYLVLDQHGAHVWSNPHANAGAGIPLGNPRAVRPTEPARPYPPPPMPLVIPPPGRAGIDRITIQKGL